MGRGVTLTPEEWDGVLELHAAFGTLSEMVWLTQHETEDEPESEPVMSKSRLRGLAHIADYASNALDVAAIDRRLRERKSRVISLDLRPEIAAKLEAEATREGISAGEMMVRIASKAVAGR
ncbi:MAG: hypothetical protein JNK60_14135 [Acidobacteria bacterium]|nr:hypothetical protein [Acidobacteriota bacterium]